MDTGYAFLAAIIWLIAMFLLNQIEPKKAN